MTQAPEFCLVPVEPTEAMLEAGFSCINYGTTVESDIERAWSSMLAAAPHTAAPAADRAVSGKDRLYDAIREVLLHHRLAYALDAESEGDALPLVDLLTPEGDKSIERGRNEIDLICDAIYNDDAVCAVLDALARSSDAPSERGGLWQRLEGLATEENNVVGAHFQEGGDPDNAPEVPEWAQLVIQLATPPAAQGADAPSEPASVDAGHPLLQRLIDSIEIVDGRACWDYMAMYEVRDALATPPAAATSTPCASGEAPMQGLAAWLRCMARNAGTQSDEATILLWAQEVEAAERARTPTAGNTEEPGAR